MYLFQLMIKLKIKLLVFKLVCDADWNHFNDDWDDNTVNNRYINTRDRDIFVWWLPGETWYLHGCCKVLTTQRLSVSLCLGVVSEWWWRRMESSECWPVDLWWSWAEVRWPRVESVERHWSRSRSAVLSTSVTSPHHCSQWTLKWWRRCDSTSSQSCLSTQTVNTWAREPAQ